MSYCSQSRKYEVINFFTQSGAYVSAEDDNAMTLERLNSMWTLVNTELPMFRILVNVGDITRSSGRTTIGK